MKNVCLLACELKLVKERQQSYKAYRWSLMATLIIFGIYMIPVLLYTDLTLTTARVSTLPMRPPIEWSRVFWGTVALLFSGRLALKAGKAEHRLLLIVTSGHYFLLSYGFTVRTIAEPGAAVAAIVASLGTALVVAFTVSASRCRRRVLLLESTILAGERCANDE